MVHLSVEEAKELDVLSFKQRITEVEDLQLEQLWSDINYELIEASDEQVEDLENKLLAIEAEQDVRYPTLEELEMMRELEF